MYYKGADMSRDKEVGVKCFLGYKLKKTQHALRLRALDLATPQYAVLAQLELKPGASNAAHLQGQFL